ncbi:MAG: beta-lactamase family protein [Solobacterium sp.]|nr:beta-lactamase family protein [Solobacterium sp.]
MSRFEMILPQEAGIPESSIRAFLKDVSRAGIELHRLMILRHGKCCCRIVWDPYGEEDFHPVYSFSKSITAAAVGFARQEGLLDLDERIADLFPEYLPENPSGNLLSCRIHHLLTMSCGHETECGDYSENWIRRFFAQPFVYEPGTFFLYNTPGTDILSAIIQKKTGQRVTEYLKPRLFDPLGIQEVKCARLPDAMGTEHGGGGMKMKLEDMAAFTQFMLEDGSWNGRKLLSD